MNTPSPATESRSRAWLKLVLGAAVVFAILVAVLVWSSKPPPGPPIVPTLPVGRLYFLMVDRSSEHTAALRGLYTLAAGETKPKLLMEEQEKQTMEDTPREWITFPRVSPDGKYLAYVDATYFITEESQTEDVHLAVMPLAGSPKPKLLLDLTAKKMNAGGGIAWTPNSDHIAFCSDGNLVQVDPVTGKTATTPNVAPKDARDPSFVYVNSHPGGIDYMDREGLVFSKKLSNDPNSVITDISVASYALSPQGVIAFVLSDHPHEALIGYGHERLYTLQWSDPWFYHGHVTSLRWSPDGKYLGYTVTNAVVPEEGFYFLRLSDGKCFRIPYSTSRAGWDWSR